MFATDNKPALYLFKSCYSKYFIAVYIFNVSVALFNL